jgi:RNA polymerase sigma-70 factor (ECF subfamily)
MRRAVTSLSFSAAPSSRFALTLKNLNGELLMTTINLRDYYPFYKADAFIEVSDEIAQQLNRFALDDEAERIRILRAKAYYSLDCGDGIEAEAIVQPEQPDEVLERAELARILNEALASLSEKQRQRISDNILDGISQSAIAKREGVKKSSVAESISRGLANLKKSLKKLF